MSIILKGINLPSKNARDYIIIGWYENNTHGGLDLKSKFVECADVIQIPKDHGRLIDADLLKDTVRDSIPAYTIGVKIPTFGDTQIMSAIDVMPTILDKERE